MTTITGQAPDTQAEDQTKKEAATCMEAAPVQTTGSAANVSLAHSMSQCDADRKRGDDIKARAAFAGCSLYELANGEWLLTRGGMVKTSPDLRSVGAVIERMVGAA